MGVEVAVAVVVSVAFYSAYFGIHVCLVAEFPRLASVVHYRSGRQLHKYLSAVHQIQLLLLRRQVMLSVGQHTVSLLQQMDPNDR